MYAIELSTGDVVGTTRVRGGNLDDTESIAIDGDGRMWLADLGDNDTERNDAALYRFPEPGPGRHSVNAKRFPVSYEGGPADIETFMVHPKTGEKFLAIQGRGVDRKAVLPAEEADQERRQPGQGPEQVNSRGHLGRHVHAVRFAGVDPHGGGRLRVRPRDLVGG